MVQDIDGIQPEFEYFIFMDPEPLDQVHVQVQASGPSDRGISKRSNFSRLRIHQNNLAVRSHDRLVAVAGVQAVQRWWRKVWVRDLSEAVEVHDAVGHFRDLAHIFRQGSYDIRLSGDVADRLCTGIHAVCTIESTDAQR